MANPLVSLPVYNPQLALLVKTPPEGDGWLHEVKLDGYRIGCRLDRGRATLFSRRAKDWTEPFATIASGAERLRARTALLDGEVAAVTPDGRTSLHAMQEGSTIAYFVFDLLHLDGDDLTSLPIEERQVRLRELLGARPRPPSNMSLTSWVAGFRFLRKLASIAWKESSRRRPAPSIGRAPAMQPGRK
jgi:ATP-dependent DNA ligase